MKQLLATLLLVIVFSLTANAQTSSQIKRKAVLLEDISWVEAEKILTPETIVVIALGAASKEHGPHLKLANDFIMAEYLKKRIAERLDVAIAPTINYNYYPAFLEYPGSTSLRMSTSRDLVVDICRGLAHYGPRRFYILNTGISTIPVLKAAAEILTREGILVQYHDWGRYDSLEKSFKQEEKGSHADETETSMMLYMAPSTVDMKKAAKDYGVNMGPGPLTRDPKSKQGLYSPTGIFGDATLATREKGKKMTEGVVEGILKEIESLRRAALPSTESYSRSYDAYVGQYQIAAGNVVTISKERESLVYQRSGRSKLTLTPESQMKFSSFYGVEIIFIRDESGEVTQMYTEVGGQGFFAKKIK